MSFRVLLRLSFFGLGLVLLTAAVRQRSSDGIVARRVEPAIATQTFDPPRETPDNDSGRSRLARGIRAFGEGDMVVARDLLEQSTGTEAQLEDWRLLLIAEATDHLGDPAAALATLGSLIRDYPESPVSAFAIQRAAEVAAESEDWQAARDWIDFARARSLPRERASQIEALAWNLGITLEDRDLQIQAGRRLLVGDPLFASELGVDDFFRQSSHEIDWAGLFQSEELELRARNLVDAGQPEEALDTLDVVPDSERGFNWSLTRAQALTRGYRGQEALRILEDLASADGETQVEILWQKALAAHDASRIRRGRANLSESGRQDMARRSQASLEQVIAATRDPERERRALRLLFTQVSDREDSFEESLALMRRLLEIDPTDTSGTHYLWQRGWRAYVRHDYPVAIGYWSELESLYQGTNPARSGRYWTGRAHEALGHPSRAQDIYREIVASGVEDFYSHHAQARLDPADEPSLSPLLTPAQPWPHDPILDRGRWLSDMGLHEFALLELEGLRERADPRAFCGQSAVVLARTGQRRESIRQLTCAFPALGRPQQVAVPTDALQLYYPLDYQTIVEQRAGEQNLSPYLVFAMIRQESAFDAAARSWAGARGLMQLMPATGREIAQRLGLSFSTSQLEDPDYSVRLGTRYFRQVLDMFEGNEVLALAGYNGGPYRIKKLWRQAGSNPELDRFVDGLALEETKTYVKRILLFEESYSRLYHSDG